MSHTSSEPPAIGQPRPLGAQSSDRCTRYRSRLDAELATFTTDHARAAFLSAELAKWLDRYATFQLLVDSGRWQGDPDAATAFDYVETLTDITARQTRYAPEPRAA